jgi:hypothetical protein
MFSKVKFAAGRAFNEISQVLEESDDEEGLHRSENPPTYMTVNGSNPLDLTTTISAPAARQHIMFKDTSKNKPNESTSRSVTIDELMMESEVEAQRHRAGIYFSTFMCKEFRTRVYVINPGSKFFTHMIMMMI